MSEADDADDGEADSQLERVVAGAVTTLTLAVAFGLLAVGYPFFWIAFVVGFAGLLPTSIRLARYYEREDEAASGAGTEDSTTGSAPRDEADALEALRDRYASGELTEAEFEERLDRLVGTESVEEARAYAERELAGDRDGSADRHRAGERE